MSLNEFELIDRFFKGLTKTDDGVICGIGDDAAVINLPPGNEMLVSTDTLVSGVHFFPSADPGDIGYKSLAVNLSDMAAMAAMPRWATLALTLPLDLHENSDPWLRGFARGFSELADRYSVSLIGGDLTHGPLSVTVQILGQAPTGTAVRRCGAGPGDLIYVSGCLGAAGYALKILSGDVNSIDAAPEACLRRLLRPEPRIELGNLIRGYATSAIDISDGLVSDLGHLLRAGSVGAVVEMERLPVCKELSKIEDPDLLWQTVLGAGDDYELCFTLPEGRRDEFEKVSSNVEVPVTRVGSITQDKKMKWLMAGGGEYDKPLGGYRHF